MAQILAAGLVACGDCVQAIANDDYTALTDADHLRIRRAVHNLSIRWPQGYPVIGDELGFCHSGCDCCHDGLAGNKHELVILGD